MISRIAKSGCLLFAALWIALPTASAVQPEVLSPNLKEWNFDVFLGGDRIGYHRFQLLQDDGREQVVSEASFKVKFAFITLYKYQHNNTETWQDDCLLSLESRTNANGKRLFVRGAIEGGAFEIKATGLRDAAEGCVKSFAYWNADFLDEAHLLNSQTGEILPVEVEVMEEEVLSVRGEAVPAQRFRLRAKDLQLDLWYSSDREWLGLRSTTNDGRTISYRLT